MKRILTVIIVLLAIVTVAQAATYYKVKVAGVEVNSDNATTGITHKDRIKPYNSSANGGKYSITYSGNANGGTLTLRNVRIDRDGSGNRAILNDGNPNLTIVFEGENYLYAKDASPVRLNGKTTLKCKTADGSNYTQIVGGSEDALTVGSGAAVTITDANLYLESKSSCFDAAGSPSLTITNSTVMAKCTYNKSGDCYALRDYAQLTVNNSTVKLYGYSEAINNLGGLTLGNRMFITTPTSGKYNSSKKTVVDANGNTAKTVVMGMSTATGIEINTTNFPDDNFRAYVRDNCDTYGDDILTTTEISNVKQMKVNNKGITTLKGIEHFTALEKLDCSDNSLTSLNLSKNTKLTELNCSRNSINTLNISTCTAITILYCSDNSLTGIDVTKHTELVKLSCSDNKLGSIDVTKNTKLKELYCSSDKLTSLNVSKNMALTVLECNSNSMETLDVSNNTALTKLICYSNKLTTLDVSKNTKLTELECRYNQLTTLDLSKNKALKSLIVYSNNIDAFGMDDLVMNLPTVTGGNMIVMDMGDVSTYNMITKGQVKNAKAKGWNTQRMVQKITQSGVIEVTITISYVPEDYDGCDPEKYGLSVCNVEVTFDNRNSLTTQTSDYLTAYRDNVNGGKPSITYDPKTKTLTVYNAKIERTGNYNRAILNESCDGLTIVFRENNSLKATNASPVRLNANTTIKGVSTGTYLVNIYGGSEDAFTVGNGATVTIQDTRLYLETESSIFDAAGNPSLIINNSDITGWIMKKKSGDCYGLRDYKHLTVNNSKITLGAPSDLGVPVVSNLQGFTMSDGMDIQYYVGDDLVGGGWYDSRNKTFLDADGGVITYILKFVRKESGLFIDKNSFPDDTFRAYVKSNFDKDGNGYLSDAEIQAVTTIDLFVQDITTVTTLKGIEYFTELSVLNCSENTLSGLDVSKNTKLTLLAARVCGLTTLDVSKNTALEGIDCMGNQLTTLDLSKNTKLTHVNCSHNQISGAGMEALVNSLPQTNNGKFYPVYYTGEKNRITKAQVNNAKVKGWKVYMDCGTSGEKEYEGEGLKGDINGDGTVDVGDIMAIINIMASNGYDSKADINGDNTVDVGDIMAIINIMAKQ